MKKTLIILGTIAAGAFLLNTMSKASDKSQDETGSTEPGTQPDVKVPGTIEPGIIPPVSPPFDRMNIRPGTVVWFDAGGQEKKGTVETQMNVIFGTSKYYYVRMEDGNLGKVNALSIKRIEQ